MYIKYLLLNPAQVFAEIIQETRAIILAGGTMSPLSDFKMQLIPDLPEERFHHFSCGHIVPHTSIQTTVLRSGPSGEEFHFTYEKRSDPRLVRVGFLHHLLLSLCGQTI